MTTLQIAPQSDRDIVAIDRAFDSVSSTAHAAALALNDAWHALWDLPDDRILAILREWGPAKVQAVFEEHYLAATSLNRMLDAADRSNTPTRAIAAAGRVISWDDAASDWVIEPVVAPEPEA